VTDGVLVPGQDVVSTGVWAGRELERLLFVRPIARPLFPSLHAMRTTTTVSRLLRVAGGALLLDACSSRAEPPMSATERSAIADTLRTMVVSAYDLTKPGDKVARMMSLYPPNGNVVSASGGRASVSRDSLAAGIRAFWEYVGQNMREPKWTWDEWHIDVLSRNAAVVTATYHVPHLTPRGQPHTIAGAMTEVFQRRDGQWRVVQEHLSDLALTPPDSAATDMSSMPMEHQH
jgi:ketosteroid isomerase-like protein